MEIELCVSFQANEEVVDVAEAEEISVVDVAVKEEVEDIAEVKAAEEVEAGVAEAVEEAEMEMWPLSRRACDV